MKLTLFCTATGKCKKMTIKFISEAIDWAGCANCRRKIVPLLDAVHCKWFRIPFRSVFCYPYYV